MAENTFTNLIPVAMRAMDVVSRELTGMIPSVTLLGGETGVEKDQTIRIPITGAGNGGDVTPAMTVAEPTAQTPTYADVTISKSRAYEFGFTGEAQRGQNTGAGYESLRIAMVAQAIRGLVNEVEADLCALHTTFSRAAGTAGTTPFGTANDYTAATLAQAILKQNGAPSSDNHLVIDTFAGANLLGKQSAVDASGDASILRQGVLRDISGMSIRESGQIVTFTKGTGASATTNNAGYAIGATTITLASAGTGTILAGDVITFAGDTNQYVVATGDSDVSNGGTIVLAAPGLRKAIAASATAITVVATSARNMCFNRSAIVLVARPPAAPIEGDLALAREIITDPRSGLSLELSMWPGQRKVRYEVALAWGVKNIKPAHTALLLG